MRKTFCDICGQEIVSGQLRSKYKLKKLEFSFGEGFWAILDVHDECYQKMCKYIKENTANEKE